MGSATGVARRESRGSSVWPSYALGTAVSLIASLIVLPVLLRWFGGKAPGAARDLRADEAAAPSAAS